MEQQLLDHVKKTNVLRYQGTSFLEKKKIVKEEYLTIKEKDILRGTYYIKYKQADLLFFQRMGRPTNEEIDYNYQNFNNIDDKYFLPEFKFHKSLLFKDEPILLLTQTGIYSCLENLCWVVYTPNKEVNRMEPSFKKKVVLLYELIEFRIRMFFDMRNNPELLDNSDFTVKFSKENKNAISANMFFVQCTGAYLDQLFLTIYDSPPVLDIIDYDDIGEERKQFLYDEYFSELSMSKILTRFDKFYADLTITPADKYTHFLKYKIPCDLSSMILQLKNDILYKQFDENVSLKELFKNQVFIDFMMVHAYKQHYSRDLQYTRNRLLDVYITKKKVAYSSLTSLIYDLYRDKVFSKKTQDEGFELLFENEEETQLNYLYPPRRD